MKTHLSTITTLAAVVLLSSCEKKETETPPPAAPVTAPSPAPAPAVEPAPAPTPAPASVDPASAAEGDSEKEAISGLKAKMEEINNMMKGTRTEENPATQLIGMRLMLGEMDKLTTEGLPTDLKDTVTRLKDYFGRAGKIMLPIFEGIPTEADALKQWGTDLAADPAKLQEVMGKMDGLAPDMQSLSREAEEMEAAVKTVFEKYGIKFLGE